MAIVFPYLSFHAMNRSFQFVLVAAWASCLDVFIRSYVIQTRHGFFHFAHPLHISSSSYSSRFYFFIRKPNRYKHPFHLVATLYVVHLLIQRCCQLFGLKDLNVSRILFNGDQVPWQHWFLLSAQYKCVVCSMRTHFNGKWWGNIRNMFLMAYINSEQHKINFIWNGRGAAVEIRHILSQIKPNLNYFLGSMDFDCVKNVNQPTQSFIFKTSTI